MSTEFNNPLFDPSTGKPIGPIGPQHFSSGVAYEHHKNIVEGIIRGLRLKQDQQDDFAKLQALSRERINAVKRYAHDLDENVRDMGMNHDMKLLAEDITHRYMDQFVSFSKDELLMVLAFYFTAMTMDEIV